MSFKDFIKPTKKKLILFIIILLLANVPYIGYLKIQVKNDCKIPLPNGQEIPCLGLNFKNIQNCFSVPVTFSKETEEQTYEMNVDKLNKLFSLKTSEEYLSEFLGNQ